MHSKENYNEPALLRELQQGNKDAFLQLYDHYYPAIYRYINKFVKLPELTEDLLQEVFLKIWTIRHRIDPGQSFQAYLYRISRNQTYKTLKKIAADNELRLQVMLQFQHSVKDADNKAQWAQYQSILRSAIEQLPPQRQKIFKLCREEGKTYKEVSFELNISPNTVKEHMVLATRSIRDYLYRYGDITLVLLLIAGRQL
jgi:RNA polymerase sigma-70 factor (ECF subfamily)